MVLMNIVHIIQGIVIAQMAGYAFSTEKVDYWPKCPPGAQHLTNDAGEAVRCLPHHTDICTKALNRGRGGSNVCCHWNKLDYYCCVGMQQSQCPTYSDVTVVIFRGQKQQVPLNGIASQPQSRTNSRGGSNFQVRPPATAPGSLWPAAILRAPNNRPELAPVFAPVPQFSPPGQLLQRSSQFSQGQLVDAAAVPQLDASPREAFSNGAVQNWRAEQSPQFGPNVMQRQDRFIQRDDVLESESAEQDDEESEEVEEEEEGESTQVNPALPDSLLLATPSMGAPLPPAPTAPDMPPLPIPIAVPFLGQVRRADPEVLTPMDQDSRFISETEVADTESLDQQAPNTTSIPATDADQTASFSNDEGFSEGESFPNDELTSTGATFLLGASAEETVRYSEQLSLVSTSESSISRPSQLESAPWEYSAGVRETAVPALDLENQRGSLASDSLAGEGSVYPPQVPTATTEPGPNVPRGEVPNVPRGEVPNVPRKKVPPPSGGLTPAKGPFSVFHDDAEGLRDSLQESMPNVFRGSIINIGPEFVANMKPSRFLGFSRPLFETNRKK